MPNKDIMTTNKRPFTADDLYHFKLVSDPQLSPDGAQVVFTVQRVDRVTEKKYTNLWIVAADGGEPRPLTHGDQIDSQPRWGKNGRFIHFLSNRADEKQPQLYTLPLNGGDARRLTDLQGSFDRLSVSPDGSRLLVQFRQKDAEAIARENDEQAKKLGVVARHITDLVYKANGEGYLPAEKWHIWTVDAESGAARQVTNGRFHETDPIWSPDGSYILFISNRSDNPDLQIEAAELYTIPADGGEMVQLSAHDGRKSNPAYADDGRVAYLGHAYPMHAEQNRCLFVTDGTSVVNRSQPFDLNLSSAITLTDMVSGMPEFSPIWRLDGTAVYAIAATHGSQHLIAFDGEQAETIIGGDGMIEAVTFDRTQTRAAYLRGTVDRTSQIWLRDMATGDSRQLTHFDDDLFAEIKMGRVEKVSFAGGDGVTLDGWITFPPDFDAAKTYPSIMEIHGGPMAQYGHAFMHEFQYLAAQGYVVYWCNPRGSQGYGDAFAAAIYGRWGTVDYDDVMAWADYMEAQPYIDPACMGVTGGSYGGYMTSMIIGRTDRFKTAVAQRVVSNGISMYGASDLGWIAELLFGTESAPWEDVEAYWQLSPMRYIGNAKTPTLIIHSENDLRCPQEQGEQVYIALKRMGVEAEMVLFPEEAHGLSRNGRTDRRVARLQHIKRWMDKYLKAGQLHEAVSENKLGLG